VTQSTTFQLFDFLVYIVWACLKCYERNKTTLIRGNPVKKIHNNDNYNLL